MTTTQQAATQYTVVLRARSAARFLPEEGWAILINAPSLDLEGVGVRAFTRWVNEGGKELPRELIIEVCGRTGSLDEATAKFATIARPLATIAGFVANVLVGPLEVHLAYDSTPSHEEREFLETFLPDERGMVSAGRIIRRHLLEATSTAFLALAVDADRVSRALRQYEMALRYWHVGGEWLALSHLWMAVETLTDAVIENQASRQGINRKQLAKSLGLSLDDPNNPWALALKHEARRRMIFLGDDDTYSTARKGRNGLEHGFMELDEVAAHALKSADRTFHYVRRTIIDLLGLAPEVADELMEIQPKDVQSMRKVIRGRLLGAAEDPAMEGQLYPLVEWSSGIESVARDGSTFKMNQKERMTIRTHPDVGFRLERLEVHGRVENGQAPVQLSDEDVAIEHRPPSPSQGLLERVMPLVDAAAGTGANGEHKTASMFAFNMFGQAVAFFQAAQAVINARQPVEALASVRGLTIMAARFEWMTNSNGAGLGIAVRAVMDALASSGADTDLIDTKLAELDAGAKAEGLTVPSELPPPEAADIFRSLRAEMNIAADVVGASYFSVGLHVVRIDEHHAGFQTALEPGPLADLVASAAVIAMLNTLVHAARLFGWTTDKEAILSTITEAQAVNEAAAQLDLRPAEGLKSSSSANLPTPLGDASASDSERLSDSGEG